MLSDLAVTTSLGSAFHWSTTLLLKNMSRCVTLVNCLQIRCSLPRVPLAGPSLLLLCASHLHLHIALHITQIIFQFNYWLHKQKQYQQGCNNCSSNYIRLSREPPWAFSHQPKRALLVVANDKHSRLAWGIAPRQFVPLGVRDLCKVEQGSSFAFFVEKVFVIFGHFLRKAVNFVIYEK